MKRVKEQQQEMKDSGIKLSNIEERNAAFMKRRAEAFEKNELDPDSMRRLMEGRQTSKKSMNPDEMRRLMENR